MRRGFLRLLVCVMAAGMVPAGGSTARASMRGPDVSSFQHPHGYSITWSAVHGSGAAFAFVKATEGASYTNAYFRRDFAALAAAHMVRGAYHFADPAPGAANAIAQARHFVDVTGSLHGIGDLPGVLDLEVNGGLRPAALVAWTNAYLVEVRRLTGRTPMLYTYPSFWQHQMGNPHAFAGYPLWLATYSTRPHLFGGWRSYTFWQYTDHARLPGLPGPVDMSVFNGTYDQLWAHANLVGASALFSHYHHVMLHRGSTGAAVMALQAALGLTVDGQFGPRTASAVSNYQRKHALRATGAVSTPVWAALSGVRAPRPTPAHTPKPSPVPASHAVTAAGFAGDGRTDILGVAKGGNLYLFRGAGNGRLAGQGQLIGRGWDRFAHVLSVGDLTGDGHPDLAGITPRGDLVLYSGNGHGGFLGAGRTIGHGWNGFAAVFSPGDLTGDGHPDLLAVTARGDLRLYRGNGHGGFLNASRLIGRGWNTFSHVFAVPGFDGPGRVDLAGVTRAGDLYLYRGTGAGGLARARRVGTRWNTFTALTASGTFAGHGSTGVLARTNAGGLLLYPGTGSGGWRAARPLGTGWNAFSTLLSA